MGTGTLDLTVNDHSFTFDPASEHCPSCEEETAYSHSVEITTDAEQTTIEVGFVCETCTGEVETVTRTVASPSGGSGAGEKATTDESQEVYDWIVEYAEREGRHPSKSKCVREVPFEIFEAQDLVDELIEDGQIEKEEELRAGAPIEVFKPV